MLTTRRADFTTQPTTGASLTTPDSQNLIETEVERLGQYFEARRVDLC